MLDPATLSLQVVGASCGTHADEPPRLPRRAEWIFFLKTYAERGGAPSLSRAQVPLPTDALSVDPWRARLDHALGIRLEPGHRIRVLRNGDEIFPAMLDAIRSATRSIEFLFFVYWEGDIPDRFCDALIDRAREGVRVRVLFDGVGSKPMSNELERRFEQSPVEVNVFHPVPHWKFWGAAARTHRKILVVDGERAFTGGVGIADEWDGDAQDPEHFRETQFEFTGPAVAGLRAAFHGNWANAGGRLPDRLDIPPADERPRSADDGPAAGVLASRGEDGCAEMALLFQLLVQSAQRTLDIVTPYFVPGQALADDLADAARRGVRVRVMTCGVHTDHQLSRWAGHRYYLDLLKAGVEIQEYDRTLLHTKAVIVDRQLSCVGSPNMNQRSLSLDDEVAVVVFDSALTSELLDDFDEDLRFCRRIDASAWADRGLMQRMKERFALLLEAQL